MTDQQYTPTTEEIERAFRAFGRTNGPISQLFRQDEFDRWLATVEAAAEQRGAIKALQDLADNHTVRIPDVLGYKVQAVFTETIWEKLDEMNRADRIANKETRNA